MRKRICFTFLLFFLAFIVLAQIPAGYYTEAGGKSGRTLKTALSHIIGHPEVATYDALWEHFKQTDVRENGTIWDMYSDITAYTPGKDQGASAGGENIGGYNREHSFPKSWFGQAKPMYSDLFHLVPTDVYVNNRRSNYPFGETNGNTWKSHNGFSKVGTCTVSGYSGTVFEPNDEYKGDFARIYFYMATCYEDKIAGWSSPMLSGDSYKAYAPWALDMLLRWAAEDPVSEKEIKRNNAVYGIQKNRNPFVDFPGLEQYVWGNKTTVPFNPDNFDGGGTIDPNPDPATPAAPTFSHTPGAVAAGTDIVITTATTGAYIYYTVNGGTEEAAYPPVTVTVTAPVTITAYARLGERLSERVTATYTLLPESGEGTAVYRNISSSADLVPGLRYIIVSESGGKNVALAEQKDDIRTYVDITVTGDSVTTETGQSGYPYALLLGGSENAWTLQDAATGCFLALNTDGNKLYSNSTTDANAQWTITFSGDGTANIIPNAYPGRSIRYNSAAPRFACYKSGQRAVRLYRQYSETDGITAPGLAPAAYSVYTASGQYIRTASTANAALAGLPAGVYVVNGRKVLVAK